VTVGNPKLALELLKRKQKYEFAKFEEMIRTPKFSGRTPKKYPDGSLISKVHGIH